MPDISSKKVVSPLEGSVRPDYGAFHRYEPLGSKDTALGRFTGNYYDRAFIPEFSQANQRYYNQDWLNATGDFFAGLGVKTASGLPSLVGGITSLAASPLALRDDVAFQDVFEMNPLNMLARSISKTADEAFPTFQREDFNDLRLFDQILRPGEAFTSNLDTLSFLAQSFLGGGLLGKIGAGAKLAGRLSGAAADVSPVLTPLVGPNLARTAKIADWLISDTVLTTNEAAAEGKDAAEQIRNQLHSDRLAGLNYFSDDEIEKKANDAAYNVFWTNFLTLSVTNGAFVKLLSPLYKTKDVLTRMNPYALKLAEKGLAEKRVYTGFDKWLFDKGYGPGMLTKELLLQLGTEGLEEDLQYSIQKVNNVDNLKSSYWESLKEYGKNFLTEGLDFSDKDREKAVGLGAILGAGSVGVSEALGFGPRKEAKNYRETRDELIKSLNEGYTNLVSSSVAKKTEPINGRLYESDGKYYHEVNGKAEEINQTAFDSLQQQLPLDNKGSYTIPSRYEIDVDGNVVIDEVKAKEFAAQAKVQAELDDLIAQELSKVNPDELKLKLYQREKLNDLAKTAFKAGATDLLLNKIDSLRRIGPEGLAELGITDETQVENEIQGMKDHISRFEELYKTTYNSTIIGSTSAEAARINKERQDMILSLGGRIIALDDLVASNRIKYDEKLADTSYDQEILKTTLDKLAKKSIVSTELQDLYAERNRINSLLPYAVERGKLKDINDKIDGKISEIKTLETDLKEAEKFIPLASDSKIQELAAMQINEDYMTKAREEAGRVFNKLIDPRKGYKNFAAHKTDRSLLTPYERARLPFSLHKDVTRNEYEAYEDRKTKQLGYNQTLKVAQHEHYSELINEFLRWAARADTINLETAESLKALVGEILDNNLRVYPEEGNKLIGYMQQQVAQIEENLNQIIDEAENIGFDIVNLPAQTPEEETLQEEFDNLQQIHTALGFIADDIQGTTDRLRQLFDYQVPVASQDELRTNAAEELVQSSETLVNMAIKDGEFNDDFDELDRVLLEEELLEKYAKDVIEPKSYEEPRVYGKLSSRIKDLLASLKRIKEQIIKNRADKELKAREEIMMRLEGLKNLVGLNDDNSPIVQDLGEELTAKLRILAEQQPLDAYYVLMDAVSDPKMLAVLSEFKREVKDTISSLAI